MTVREVEEVASEVAAAALKEFGVLLDWRDEWPDEAGYWLFWGYQKPNGRQFLMLMDAQHDSNGALSFIGEGSFWYKEEDLLRGKFAKASGIPLPA